MAAQSMSAGSELLHRFLIDLIDVNQPKAFSSSSSQEADRIVGRYSTSRMNMPASINISLDPRICSHLCSGVYSCRKFSIYVQPCALLEKGCHVVGICCV